jgi:transcriptional regulator with XRE-family HTH domain
MTEVITASLGDRVRLVREERGLTYAQLSELVKKHGGAMTKSALVHLEERSSRSSRSSRALALALGVNHDWLLTGKGPKETVRSLDSKLQLLPQDDFDELYDDFNAVIERRLEKRNIRP